MTIDPEFLELAEAMQRAVRRARELYPWERDCLARQTLALASEVGELCEAVAKGHHPTRINDEAMDVLVTAYRVLVRR